MKTFSATPSDIDKKWILIDAEGLVLGRLASIIASRLRGKHLPTFTPHMDTGDNIVVINADKVALTGKKRENKLYHHHTGHPGGLKTKSAEDILDGRFPTRVLESAVKRMLPGGPLSRKQMRNLYLYTGAEHEQTAQKPEVLDVAAMNSKNVKGRK
ncbi:MAG: 50S ribosomal protein L13 [Rhizobiales bacterium]|nr:50S ribosomal protein L13 [Hyphomicrobiales bacterium]